MSHRKFEHPRHGSLGFLPRKRASRHRGKGDLRLSSLSEAAFLLQEDSKIQRKIIPVFRIAHFSLICFCIFRAGKVGKKAVN